jgi:hypothetical protein
MKIFAWLAPLVIGGAATLGSAPNVDEAPASLVVASVVGYDGIPRNALRASSGRDVLRLRISRDGMVWVGDDDEKRQMLRLRVRDDDVVQVDPYADVVMVNKVIVWREGMSDKHRRSIFYLDGRDAPRWDRN